MIVVIMTRQQDYKKSRERRDFNCMSKKKKPISEYMHFYPSFRKAIDSLQDDKKRLEAYDMLTDLGLYEMKPSSTYERDLLLFLLTFITARENNE